MSEVLNTLGFSHAGGNYVYFRSVIATSGFSVSHWRGQGWSRGKTTKTDAGVAKMARAASLPDSRVFVQHGPKMAGPKLMKRLLDLGWEYKCGECGNPGIWQNKPLCLEVHHINGIDTDHRFKNLAIICPNCHRQTGNWGNTRRIRSESLVQSNHQSHAPVSKLADERVSEARAQ